MLEVKNITVSMAEKVLIKDISFDLVSGDRFMIIGPNGAGKSTIINAISQGVTFDGTITLNGSNIKNIKTIDIAKSIGFLSQQHYVNYSFTVEDIVNLGRYCHSSSIFSEKKQDDQDKVLEALEITGLMDQRHQSILTLSGGELQRTFLAQLFAQDPSILILDEPTNHLDIQYQRQLFEILDEWMDKKNRAIMAVVHDLSLARQFGNKFLLMDNGTEKSYGSSSEVLSQENLSDVYKMDVFSWMKSLYNQWEF